VDAFRDHGSLRFIHLRDVRGIVQVVFNPEVGKESYDRAAGLKEEYVVQVRGKVGLRLKGTENPTSAPAASRFSARSSRFFLCPIPFLSRFLKKP